MNASEAAAPALRSETIRIHPLFPTLVWRTRLAPATHEPLNHALLASLERMSGGFATLGPGEMYQSRQDLHRLPEFEDLVGWLEAAVGGVLESLRVAAPEAAITGCWANVGAPGAMHRPHTHPNNLLSGVYYVRAAAGADRITFDDPRPQSFVISPPAKEATLENAAEINLTVGEGSLLLFPAWLQHRVGSNRSADLRVSIAFNVMLPDAAFADPGEEPPVLRRVE